MRSIPFLLGVIAMALTCVRPAVGADACCPAPEGGAPAPASVIAGTVVATTNASRYTYVQIDTGAKHVWAAGPMVEIKVGDRVSFNAPAPTKNFSSPTLKRKFDELYFVEAITRAGEACPADAVQPGMPPSHPALKTVGGGPAADTVFDPIQKPEGGKTVAEVWAEKDALSGKRVVVRGKVVKVVSDVMGRNFLHLRDGSGRDGNNDLTVTTTNAVKVGMIVTAGGSLSTDKDFGSGYRYDVLMEDATVTAN